MSETDIVFLPNHKAAFDVTVKGENTGMVYTGKFVIRLFLSLKQRQSLAVEYSRRDIGNEKDAFMSSIVQSICELTHHCEETPDWFKPDRIWDLVDLQPIVAVREKLEEALEIHVKALNQ